MLTEETFHILIAFLKLVINFVNIFSCFLVDLAKKEVPKFKI